MRKPKLLIIEPNVELQTLLRLLLAHHQFEVYTAAEGDEGLRHFYLQRPDIVLFDLNPASAAHWETLRLLRLLAEVSIVIMGGTVHKQVIERSLQSADAYIAKPFQLQALLATLQALVTQKLSRFVPATGVSDPMLMLPLLNNATIPAPADLVPTHRTPHHHGRTDQQLAIDLKGRRVYAGGQFVRLTDLEFRVLECLAKQAGRVLTYQQILNYAWGWEEGRNHHYVHVHISRLRQKLEVDPKDPQHLLTEHGVGYWLRGLLQCILYSEMIDAATLVNLVPLLSL